MKILLASTNAHKLKELALLLKGFEVLSYSELLRPFEIEEVGLSFKQNALIKSRAVFKRLSSAQRREFVVLSDDSGLSVEALNEAPGIYSARFSKQGDDRSNRAKLISELKALGLEQSKAHYTACIGLSSIYGDLTAQGFLRGVVISKERGQNGFGYDSVFVPLGFNKTLGELDESVKMRISHRF